jgi:hypothetical protein
MDIPDDTFWCVARAAIWIATRNPDAVLAQLSADGDRWTNANAWLIEHKDKLLPPYLNCGCTPLELAIKDIAKEILWDRLKLYVEGGEVLKSEVRLHDADDLRNWIWQGSLQARAVEALWPYYDNTKNPTSSPNLYLFERPYWSIFNAIGWGTYRSKHAFGNINDMHSAIIRSNSSFKALS